ncbi:uncharacterized protein LOC143197131 [Rhynchophorus ferrugineus]|uniref:CAP-Gly domain-containing protein n=1 Tax=Rhynchophorus ferrugineus TaxID=354439 RepID=A0A834ICF8_RHYFE|nr:hypothetical protein GWI33_008492 [Rhynchophorus ferrugineus]
MDFGVGVSQSGGLETVRALHQTIVALRTALEQSKNEILELKSKAWPIDSVQDVIKSLSLENHILRQQIIENKFDSQTKLESSNKNTENEIEQEAIKSHVDILPNDENIGTLATFQADVKDESEKCTNEQDNHDILKTKDNIIEGEETKQKHSKKVTIISPPLSTQSSPQKTQLETRIVIKAHRKSNKNSRSLESLTVLKSPLNQKVSLKKTFSFSNLSLVKREINFNSVDSIAEMTDQEDIEEHASNRYEEEMLSPQNDIDQEVDDIELIFTTDETKDQDFKEELVPIDTRESNSNLLNLPLSDIDQVSDRELDDDVFNDGLEVVQESSLQNQSSFELKRENSIFNSHSDNSINHEKSLKSYYSYQDSSFENKSLEKDESFDRFEERVRIIETDISKCGIHEMDYVGGRRNTCPNPIQYRPLSHREVMSKGTNSRRVRPILTHSNAVRRESGAQTDISAIPSSSAWRSESSLAHKSKLGDHFTTLPSKYPMPGSRLKLSEKTVEARRVLLSDIGFTSMVPELSRSADHLCPGGLRPPSVTTYGQFLKATDLYSPGCLSQKFTWTATTATPSESSQTQSRYSSIYPLSPPAPSRRCSVPASPSRRAMLKSTSSKVRFANGSLPELRTEWATVDSGDSTDSLVEEAENFLRRSIDCIVTTKESTYGETKKTVPRRASAPEPSRDNVPPQGWQPFLPRLPRDLKLDNWVKVITPEGRVRGGRVRYIGIVATQEQEQYVGVQLACPEGVSDGVYAGRRYFQCEPYHGIFIPFKKVIMGWRP